MTREEALEELKEIRFNLNYKVNGTSRFDEALDMAIKALEQGHCKDCKYFEYDSLAKVNGIPLIVAHEICERWGDGCKTSEDGYCFLFETKED